jgi:IMP dehydrogenase
MGEQFFDPGYRKVFGGGLFSKPRSIEFRSKINAHLSVPEMLNFRDVIIMPQLTEYNVREVQHETTAKLGPFTLNYPGIAAAMDKVTEEEMAIKMALYGGAGVIHRNFGKPQNSPELNEKIQFENQIRIAKKVKRTRSNMVIDVTTVCPDDTITYASSIMDTLRISGLIVVDNEEDRNFLGILTRRDVRVPDCLGSKYQKVQDAMTPKKDVIWAKEGISMEDAEKLMYTSGRMEKLPVLDKNGEKIVGLMTLKDMYTEYPNAALDDKGRLLCFAAISHFKPQNKENLKLLKELDKQVDVFFTDVAHFHKIPDFVAAKEMMEMLDSYWVVGNIGTYEAMEDIITKANFPEDKWVGVKTGMWSGSICTTTLQTGVGAPTLFATVNVADALKDYGLFNKITLIADGGFEYPGDIPKAFTSGATIIMSGHYFAGTTESPGYIDTINGRKVKVYRGMGSTEARMEGNIGDRYDVNQKNIQEQIPEGVSTYVPYVGDLSRVVTDHISAIKQAMNYTGSTKITDFHNCRFGKAPAAGHKKAAPSV